MNERGTMNEIGGPGPGSDGTRSGRRRNMSRKFAAAGLAAGLLGGGAAGVVLSNAPLSGAAAVSSIQQAPPADGAGPDAPRDGQDPATRHQEHLNEVLAPLVDAGTINADQAEAVIQALLEDPPEHPRGERGGKHPMRMRLDAAATAIGVERSELADALRSGSTIAQVAAEHDVEAQAVIDAMVAEATGQLQAAVDSGRMSQDQMDERVEGLEERVSDLVNNGRPDRGGPPPAPEGEGD